MPTAPQRAWQGAEYGMFVRLDFATLTGGNRDPKQFNPTSLDVKQWMRTAVDCGFRRLIVSANDDEGFCFWPTATTEFSVAHAAWRDGKGDIVGEVAKACRAAKLDWGISICGYHNGHAISDEQLCAALTELLTRYGPVAEIRLDGAGGEGNGALPVIDAATAATHAQRNWPAIFALIRKLQPQAIIVSNIGPDARWNGNNIGHCGEPMWSPFNPRALPGPELTDKAQLKVLNSGDPSGTEWIPAEAFIPLRPQWSWQLGDDAKLIVDDRLFSAYCKSIGRNCTLLVNVPVGPTGELPDADVAKLRALRAEVARHFSTNLATTARVSASNVREPVATYAAAHVVDGDPHTIWATEDGSGAGAWIELDFGKPTTLGFIELREPIAFGQRIATYRIEVPDGDGWKVLLRGKSVGRRKIERPPATTAAKLRIVIEDCRAAPTLSEVAVYAP